MNFPAEFFQNETREGFFVPEMMKRAWAAELEVLEIIDALCQRNSIAYTVSDGTLLGAVRHKGFIPWDDDIDICMLREDYDRFIQIAPDELPAGFVLSGIYGSEPRLWEANDMPQARVIADETYFSLPQYMNRFHAFPYFRVGIDIFPYTYLPKSIEEQYRLIQIYYAFNFTAANLKLYRQDGILGQRLLELQKYTSINLYDDDDISLHRQLRLAADRWIAASPKEGADCVVDAMFLEVPDDKNEFHGFDGRKKDWYNEIIKMPFESTTVNVPMDYHNVLVNTFGNDYMTPVRFSAEHSYPFYKTQEVAFRQLLDESGVTTSTDEFCRNWQKMIGEI